MKTGGGLTPQNSGIGVVPNESVSRSAIYRSAVSYLRLERLPDECPPLSGVHPPECRLGIQRLHRGQPDEQRLAADRRPGHGLKALLLPAAFRRIQFVPKPARRDDTESDSLIGAGV